jgi:hypothetical protein
VRQSIKPVCAAVFDEVHRGGDGRAMWPWAGHGDAVFAWAAGAARAYASGGWGWGTRSGGQREVYFSWQVRS